MAGRPPKESLDFAGWDTGIFDNDPKIDKLMDAQGCIGFVIYFYLCQKAYGSNGYYYSWCYDDSATTARKIGGGAGAKSVEETVRYCLQIGLFDKGLFDGWKILTSRGIQKRFRLVAKERTGNKVIQEYWLLKKEESAGLNFYTLKLNFTPPKIELTPPVIELSPPYSKVKESKVKDKESGARAPTRTQKKFVSPTLEQIAEYCKQRGNGVDPQRFFDYFTESGWIDSEGKPVRSWKQKIITWEGRGNNNHTLPKPQPKQNRFVNFNQRDNDYNKYEKLERAYLEQKYSINPKGADT